MDENTIEDNPITISPTGIPTGFGVALVMATVLASGTAVYYARQTTPVSTGCEASSAAIVAGAGAQKAQMEMGAAGIKRDMELRLEVIKQCVGKGNIPTLSGGNVDCKASPK